MAEDPRIDDLEILERSNSTYIIRLLEKYPGLNKTEIMCTEGRNLSTKNRRLDELVQAGLLDIDEGPRREMIFSLSEYGKRIAPHLDAICEILKEHNSYTNEDGTVYIDPLAIEKMRKSYKNKHEQMKQV